jgi:hypothetical protein
MQEVRADCPWEACWLGHRCARPSACAPSHSQLAARLTGAVEGAPPAFMASAAGGAFLLDGARSEGFAFSTRRAPAGTP